MTTPYVDPRSYVPQDTLYAWMLVDPANPTLVGEVRLSQLNVNRAIFRYTPTWWNFPLSEDLPLIAGQDFTAHEGGSAPGALDDARPDRWGERIIRAIAPPARLSILEMLLFAGDQRFGALGISVSGERYLPRQVGPLPQLNDLAQLTQAVEDVQTQTLLPPALQRLVQPGASLGGARPKALIQTENGPCVIKFSELGDTVDTPLIEHATMTLAATCGINVATTGVLPLPPRHGKARHALTIQRFDRMGDYRLHCLSAHTVLRAAGLPHSYSALATVLLRLAHPDRQTAQREELFKRMVFNILMDNTDDHERNHALLLNFDGYYALTPVYDVVPSLQNIGYQAMAVGAQGAESTLDNALSHINDFGIKRPRALALVTEVARTVDQWQTHFIQRGVCPADMAQLTASINRDALKKQRLDY
jgi:serine/threonine-protein kinase HipA